MKLVESLDVILGHIPADARFIPGHGPVTSVGRERQTNPFLLELQAG